MEASVHPLADCRRRLGNISQDAFGEKVGVDGMTVSRWERGESLPRRRFWPKIEELTGRPIAEIIAAARPASEAAE
jgi:transcriptional regulator with XRE-family HTH domain